MKKEYVRPCMTCEDLGAELAPLCASGDILGSGAGVDAVYGGVDTNGSLTPSTKGRNPDKGDDFDWDIDFW